MNITLHSRPGLTNNDARFLVRKYLLVNQNVTPKGRINQCADVPAFEQHLHEIETCLKRLGPLAVKLDDELSALKLANPALYEHYTHTSQAMMHRVDIMFRTLTSP